MMRVDPLYRLNLVDSLGDLTAQQNALSSQLSSGLRVAQASDDPVAASQSVRLGSEIARDDAYVQAAAGLQSRLQVSDSALGSVTTELTSAIALVVEGLNGTQNSDNLKAIGLQLAGIRDEVVSLANSSYAGGFLFGGTNGAVRPFTNDSSTTPATVVYSGDGNSPYAVTPGGQKIATGVPGSSVFTASGADALGSLNRLVAEFSSGTASAAAQSDLSELRAGLDAVSFQRGALGASLNTIENASTYATTEETNLQASQSRLVSADTAQVATQLSASETQQQALLAVIGSAGKYNLFDDIQS